MAFKVFAFGVKVPPSGVDQVPPVAAPPTVPSRATVVPPWQIGLNAGPAFAVGARVIVTVTSNLAGLSQALTVWLA